MIANVCYGYMQVTNNIPAFAVFRHYTENVARLRESMSKLSSGSRIVYAGDDPAGIAISERLRMQYRNTAAASSNIENKINYLQTAEGWLQKIHDIMGRMSELAIIANDGTKSQQDRDNLQMEFEQMQKEIQRITSGATAAAKFNGLYLFREGTGVPALQYDLVVGASTRGGGRVTNLGNDGSSVTAADWKAVYSTGEQRWTIQNITSGATHYLELAPDEGGSIDLEGANGFRLTILQPLGGTYDTGDIITWTNDPYIVPVMGSPSFNNTTATTNASLSVLGNGSAVTNGSWIAQYNATAAQWTISRNGVTQGTIACALDAGCTGTFEGANGFRLTIDAPTDGSYATGDRFVWNNWAASLGTDSFQNASSSTTGAASNTVTGNGSGVTTADWRAQYDTVAQRWTITNETTSTIAGYINAAPNAGGAIQLEGANGTLFTIQAPTSGEYTLGDRFTWSNTAITPPIIGHRSFSDNTTTVTGSASTNVLGGGTQITDADWSATYDAVTQQWTIRNETTGTDMDTINAAPDSGGWSQPEGPFAFRFTVNAPTNGEYSTGDRFTWTNAARMTGPATLTPSTTTTTGASSATQQGNGIGITTADWSATYDAVTQQWTVRNETTSTNVGTINATPIAGGTINLEGPNGFQFVVSAPTSGQYTSGDRFTWSNTAPVPASAGSTLFVDHHVSVTPHGSTSFNGTGRGVTTADWSATYNAVTQQWTVRNETTSTNVGTINATPIAGGAINLEGPNGFQFRVGAPLGEYTTGDRFTWSNTRLLPPTLGSNLAYTGHSPAVSATTTYQNDGYDVSASNWRITYDAAAQQWEVRNTTTNTVAGYINANPSSGGSLTNIEGADGFTLTINAPGSGSYSTGDYFEFQNDIHSAASTEGPYYDDIKTKDLRLQIGPDSNQVFQEQSIDLQAGNFDVIGEYATYSYGSINMTLLGSTQSTVRWASLICCQHLSISDQTHAQSAVDKLNVGIDHISSIRAVVGAEMNRLEHTLGGLRSYEENIRATESRIRDVDIARETTEFTKYQILAKLGTAILAQANALPNGILNLLS